MRLCLILCAMLVASCGQTETVAVRTYVPADLLTPEPGWRGGPPVTQRDFVEAAEAERAGRLQANRKLQAVREIVGDARPTGVAGL